MTITPFAFVPPNGLRDASYAPTDPPNEAALRQALQGIPDQLKDYINNTLLPTLASTTASSSGAREIGSETLPGIVGNTVYAQLLALLNYINSISIGNVPINSITNDKLGTDVKVGSLAALTTTDKASVVNAINELDTDKLDVTAKAADSNLLDGIDSTGFGRDNQTVTTITTGFASGWSGTVYIIKNLNKVVHVSFDLTRSTDMIAGNDTILTLPVGTRPQVNVMQVLLPHTTGLTPVLGSDSPFYITSAGQVTIYGAGTLTGARRVLNNAFEYLTT